MDKIKQEYIKEICFDISKEIILPRIEYDFNSAQLRQESKIALDALIDVLKDRNKINQNYKIQKINNKIYKIPNNQISSISFPK